jgi:hypothetical protein
VPPPPSFANPVPATATSRVKIQTPGVGLSFYQGVRTGLLLCVPIWLAIVGLIAGW